MQACFGYVTNKTIIGYERVVEIFSTVTSCTTIFHIDLIRLSLLINMPRLICFWLVTGMPKTTPASLLSMGSSIKSSIRHHWRASLLLAVCLGLSANSFGTLSNEHALERSSISSLLRVGRRSYLVRSLALRESDLLVVLGAGLLTISTARLRRIRNRTVMPEDLNSV